MVILNGNIHMKLITILVCSMLSCCNFMVRAVGPEVQFNDRNAEGRIIIITLYDKNGNPCGVPALSTSNEELIIFMDRNGSVDNMDKYKKFQGKIVHLVYEPSSKSGNALPIRPANAYIGFLNWQDRIHWTQNDLISKNYYLYGGMPKKIEVN